MKLPVAILAGGLATRLHPITTTIPKSLVDVAGKPFIFHQLDYLRQQGVRKVILCIGFLGEQIQSLIGDGSAQRLEVTYSQDWPDLMGTAGALRKALPLLGLDFLTLYGDSYLPIDFTSVERAYYGSGKPALMTVQRNVNKWDKSNVLFQNGVIVEYNKQSPTPDMKYIDYGLGAMSAQVLEKESATERLDLADLYHRLSLSGQLAGFEVQERFYEIGSHQGLAETSEYLKGNT